MSPEAEDGISSPEAAAEAARMEAAKELQAEQTRVIEALKTGDYEAMGELQDKMMGEASSPSEQIRANITSGLMYHQAGLAKEAGETLDDALMYAEGMGDEATAKEIEELFKRVV